VLRRASAVAFYRGGHSVGNSMRIYLGSKV